jgi:hypothetical protein
MDNSKIPHIKANAQIPIVVGTAIINNLQVMYAWLLEGKTKEDAERIKVKIENKEQLTGPEQAIVTISTLLSAIHKEAMDNGYVEFKDLEETVKGISGL